MALISCPECFKQISDTAPACPHCGYVLSTAEVKHPEPTAIGEVSRNVSRGVGEIVIGFFIFLAGFPLLGLFFIGIIPIIFGFAIMDDGANTALGKRQFVCPYCGETHRMAKRIQALKCSRCKMRSVRDGDYLNPVP